MNPESDGGTATLSDIYNQTRSCTEAFALRRSGLNRIASLPPRDSSRHRILGIKVDLSEIILLALSAHVRQVLPCGRARVQPKTRMQRVWRARLALAANKNPLRYTWRGSIVAQDGKQ